MRYADEQIKRPRFEEGIDYGSTNRRVLTRNGTRQLLLESGHTATSGSRDYNPTTLELWWDDPKDDPNNLHRYKHRTLEEGKITEEIIRRHSGTIQKHLQCQFDISLIQSYLTLLLDEPGVITIIPKRKISPPKQYMKVPYTSVWSVISGYDNKHVTIATIEWQIVKQSLGVATLSREWEFNGRKHDRTIKVKTEELAKVGYFPTREEALQNFIDCQVAEFNKIQSTTRRHIELTNQKLSDIKALQCYISSDHGYATTINCESTNRWQEDAARDISKKFLGESNPTVNLVSAEIAEVIAHHFNQAYKSQG